MIPAALQGHLGIELAVRAYARACKAKDDAGIRSAAKAARSAVEPVNAEMRAAVDALELPKRYKAFWKGWQVSSSELHKGRAVLGGYVDVVFVVRDSFKIHPDMQEWADVARIAPRPDGGWSVRSGFRDAGAAWSITSGAATLAEAVDVAVRGYERARGAAAGA